jgi:hypothetical protein
MARLRDASAFINGSVRFRKVTFSSHGPWIEADDHAIRTFCDKAPLKQMIAGQAFNSAGVRCFVRK